jgi:hypothetical protein
VNGITPQFYFGLKESALFVNVRSSLSSIAQRSMRDNYLLQLSSEAQQHLLAMI